MSLLIIQYNENLNIKKTFAEPVNVSRANVRLGSHLSSLVVFNNNRYH